MAVQSIEPLRREDSDSDDHDAICTDPEQPLLNRSSAACQQRRSTTIRPQRAIMPEPGMLRAYYLGAVCCIGGFLCMSC